MSTTAAREFGSTALSPTSVAVCNYLGKVGTACFEQLYGIFGTEPRNPSNVDAFRKRLANLAAGGHLRADGKGPAREWCLASAAPPPVRQPTCAPAALAEAAPARPTSVATPPCYDLQRAPAYVPPPREAVRAGADDFLRCASVGARC